MPELGGFMFNIWCEKIRMLKNHLMNHVISGSHYNDIIITANYIQTDRQNVYSSISLSIYADA